MVQNIPLEIMSVDLIQTCDHCVILVYDAMSKNQLNQKLMLIVVAHDTFYIIFLTLERFCFKKERPRWSLGVIMSLG